MHEQKKQFRPSPSAASTRAVAVAQQPPLLNHRRRLASPLVAAAAAPEGAEGGAADAFDDIDWTEDMPGPVRRRVAALRGVQERQDEVNRAFVRERAEIEAKYAKQLGEPSASAEQTASPSSCSS